MNPVCVGGEMSEGCVTMEGGQLNSGAAFRDGAASTAPRRRLLDETVEVSPVGTILNASEPSVSGTRRESEIRHQERQLCSTELLILAGRCADQDTAGVLIEAAVAISRRRVA